MRTVYEFLGFCIVGAPKAGTTSLFAYLGEHSAIWVPKHMKEPRYYACDAPNYRQVKTFDAYFDLFAPGNAMGKLCGEASAAYLFSPVAIRHLLADNPHCKLIAMVRNPLEMLPSLHAQKLWAPHGEEHIEDFAQAWRLSPQRRVGLAVRTTCKAPRYLDYQRIGLLGEQLARLQQALEQLAAVPGEQLHVIVHDDLRADVRGVYQGVLAYLGLPDDGRVDFEAHNTRKRQRFPLVMQGLTSPPVRAVKRWLKGVAPIVSHTIGTRLYAAASAPAEHAPLRPDFRAELIEFYRDDVALLGQLLGRDLSHWLA